MQRHRAIRVELDPNNRVQTLLFKSAGTARFAWNWSLARRIERFNTNEGKDKFTNAFSEHKELVKLKKDELSWLYDVAKDCPQYALRALDQAFKRFWKERKSGVGFPKFKKKGKTKDSFSLQHGIKIYKRHIYLPRLGWIRAKEPVELKQAMIKHATISRVADRWFVSLSVIEEVSEPIQVQGPVIGIDLGITTFATLSDGTKVSSPQPLKKILAKLKQSQKSLSRKQKGSSNRKKAILKVSKIYARIANIRQDFLHKLTTMLAKTKSVIVIEDLNVKGMVRNHNLSKSISDQGWGEFRRQLEYKTEWYGSKLVIADRWFASSKICSSCGHRLDKLPLFMREWSCPYCGAAHDRDINSAINLEKYPGCQGNWRNLFSPKPVEIPLTAGQELSWSTSYGSTKQEADSELNHISSVEAGS
jgi:putative transposase